MKKNETLWARRDARIEKLISGMTLEEKVSQLVHDAPAVPRVGLPAYAWWSEALHGVGRNGKATVFPQATSLAATFDRALARSEGEVIGREGRAKFNLSRERGWQGDIYRGLTFWAPNVNLFRDPRWGRGQETLGEDPFLSGALGAEMVRGMQGPDPENHMLVAACAKHFAVHSGPERSRHAFNARPPKKDFRESYLPQFKALVDAGVEAVMGAYNRTYDEPCCGSKLLLEDILRGEWGFRGHVVSDCWAIQNFWKTHKVCKTPEQSAALALSRGCDLNCGSTYPSLVAAVKDGLVSEMLVDRALRRLLRTRAKLGLFDPPEEDPYKDLGAADVDTPAHRAVARRAALESAVLLRNEGGCLPIDGAKLRHIHVVGPHAASLQALIGNYYGVSGRMTTVLEGVTEKADGAFAAKVSYSMSCPAAHDPLQGPAVGECWGADYVVACFGLDGTMEGEESDAPDSDDTGDRDRIELPPNQVRALRRIKKYCEGGSKLVLLLFGGSPIAVPPDIADAILWVGYPGEEGGSAVADLLFGDAVPSGHLPFTVPKSTADLPPFEDYAMAGRTYKFLEKEPLWPFGFGLSYATFALGAPKASAATLRAGETLEIEAPVKNLGSRAATFTAQVYVEGPAAAKPAPRLVEFARVDLKPGEEKVARFALPAAAFETFDAEGAAALRPGAYTVTIADCAPIACAAAAGRTPPVSLAVRIA